MQPASLPIARIPHLALQNGIESDFSDQKRSLQQPYRLESLSDLLQLVGPGIGSRCTYLLLPPEGAGSSTGLPRASGWLCVTWRADGNETTAVPVFRLPLRVRRWLSGEVSRIVETRGDVFYDDENAEALVSVYGPRGNLLGCLGVAYPQDVRPAPAKIRLLQDIIANHLRSIAPPRRPRRADLQRAVDTRSVATLIIEGETIDYLNDSAAAMLGGSSFEEIAGRRIDDFVAAHDSDVVCAKIDELQKGLRKTRFETTIVSLDGSEHHVELYFRRRTHRTSAVIEVELRELARSAFSKDPLFETISEAVWHVRLCPSVSCALSSSSQARQIGHYSLLVECNQTLASHFGVDSVKSLLGSRLREFASGQGKELVEAFVQSGYNLKGYEFAVGDTEKGLRLFRVNASATVEDGRLTDIWGSCSEITEKVELERKTVALQEQQQERIGRDLHDSVAPLLTGMRLLSGDLMEGANFANPAAHSKIEKIAGFAEEATHRLGEIYRGLVPRVLEEKTLAEALAMLTESLDGFPGVAISLSADIDADVESQEEKVQLYRIVQEAINNALKHASATMITVSIAKSNKRLNLEIADNGKGFDQSVRSSSSLGLDNMRRRARSVGAALSIKSAPGSGTTITVSRGWR